jgi:hypothetical protein
MSLRKIKRRHQRAWAHTACVPLFVLGGGISWFTFPRDMWRSALADAGTTPQKWHTGTLTDARGVA